MTASNLGLIRPFLPPDGRTHHTASESPLGDVSADLCRIASFLQQHDPSSKLERFHDWWEHDALHFPHGSTDYHRVFQAVGSPRSIIESMTGDHRVFIAISPESRRWYLRYFADWDEDDSHLIGEYSITLTESLTGSFCDEVLPSLRCPMMAEDGWAYFRRIEAQ